jgi:hypothetical protein
VKKEITQKVACASSCRAWMALALSLDDLWRPLCERSTFLFVLASQDVTEDIETTTEVDRYLRQFRSWHATKYILRLVYLNI